MADLLGCGVDNAVIGIDAPKVAIMEGRAAAFAGMIERVGTVEHNEARQAIWVNRPIV